MPPILRFFFLTRFGSILMLLVFPFLVPGRVDFITLNTVSIAVIAGQIAADLAIILLMMRRSRAFVHVGLVYMTFAVVDHIRWIYLLAIDDRPLRLILGHVGHVVWASFWIVYLAFSESARTIWLRPNESSSGLRAR